MKKLFTLFMVLSVAVTVYAQQPKSQRLVLVEEFTNASCGPCAAANPAFNTLLDANATKVVAIKYQTDWPGVDPMNAQTGAMVDTRVTYYGVTGVPHAEMDGNAHDDHPANFTQAWIDTEYGVTSPFTIGLTHNLSADYDSIFIRAIITCTQAVTLTGPVKGHVVIVENAISFCAAPGANGETDFYDVMRLMLPSADGTTLATSWTVGQADTLDFAVPLPGYIYDKNQIAVVAFVQDNSDKNVKQAGYSPPQQLVNDATLPCSALTGVPMLQCTTDFTPSVTIKNLGSATLTAANINYQIDNNTPGVQNWTGSLASGATANVTMPTVTGTSGTHTFKVYITDPNGSIDYNTMKDTAKAIFNISPASVTAPLTEGFVSTTYPPTGFMINNHDNDGYTWIRSTTGVAPTATGSSKLSFYSIPSGLWDELILPPLNASSLAALGLTFSVANARYSASYADQLEVYVSIDCGANWISVYDKSGATLATVASFVTSAFTPTAAQWRTEYINLGTYAGQAQLFVKFVGTSDYGNNLYIDNINLSETAGIADGSNYSNNVTVYPNPVQDNASIDVTLAQKSNVTVNIVNDLGQQVYSDKQENMNAGTNHITFDGSSLPAGIYFIKVLIGTELHTLKVSLVK